VEASFDDMEDSWYYGIPGSFGWKRKFIRYCRETFSFFGFLLCWVGMWDFIDVQTIPDSIGRSCIYVGIPILIAYFFEYVLSIESLYYFCAISKKPENEDEHSELLTEKKSNGTFTESGAKGDNKVVDLEN